MRCSIVFCDGSSIVAGAPSMSVAGAGHQSCVVTSVGGVPIPQGADEGSRLTVGILKNMLDSQSANCQSVMDAKVCDVKRDLGAKIGGSKGDVDAFSSRVIVLESG